MQRHDLAQATLIGEGDAMADGRAIYVYCVADAGERLSLGRIGLDGAEVYCIPYHDLCAVAHACVAQPYSSGDSGTAREWVLEHERVVEAAWKKWGTVLPLAFDTLFRAEAGANAEENVRSWLQTDYPTLRQRLDRVRDREEYGVQVSWDPQAVARHLMETSAELKTLSADTAPRSKGLAYMHRQRLEQLLGKEMEVEAHRCF